MDRASDMREIANILEEGFGDKLKAIGDEILSGAGDMEASGRKDKRELASAMQKQYKQYLGRTGSKNNEESLMKFLVGQLDLTPKNAITLFGKVGIQNPTTAESLKEDISAGQIGQLFDAVAEFAFANGLVGDDVQKKLGSKGSALGSGRRKSSGSSRGGAAADLRAARQAAEKEGKAPATNGNGKLDKNKMLNHLKKLGVDEDDIKDIDWSISQGAKFDDLAADGFGKGKLAAIGFAYLMSNGK